MRIYIPVEVKTRELKAKVLLSQKLIHAGFEVFLGRKAEIQRLCEYARPGIFLAPGAFKNLEQYFKRLKSRGFLIAVNEEEGLVTYKSKMYEEMRLDRSVLSLVDLFIAWGDEGRQTVSNFMQSEKFNCISIGNPRMDLLKKPYLHVFEEEINCLKERYGNFLLFPSSFSSVNHFDPSIDYIEELKKKKTLRSQRSVENFSRYFKVKRDTFQLYLKAIETLAADMPYKNFVIRPHPSESQDAYKALELSKNNVFVDGRLSIQPWILACDGVVHHYCTTAIEAALLRKPIFGFRPFPDKLSEKEFPFNISEVSKSIPELKRSISKLDSGRVDFSLSSDQLREIRHHFSGVDSDSISTELSSCLLNLAKKQKFAQNNIDLKSVLNFVRDAVPGRRNNQYINHKFDAISIEEICKTLSYFSKNIDSYHIKIYKKNVVRMRLK